MEIKKLTNEPPETVNIIIFGISGSGKTRGAVNGLEDCLIVGFEKNGLTSTEPSQTADMVEFFDASGVSEVLEIANAGTYKTIVFDGFTHYSEYLAKAFQEIDDKTWGLEYTNFIRDFFVNLINSPTNIVFTMLEESIIQDGYKSKAPTMVGDKFRNTIVAKVDICLHAEKISNDNSIYRYVSEGDIVGKNRLKRFFPESYTHFGHGTQIETVQDILDVLSGSKVIEEEKTDETA